MSMPIRKTMLCLLATACMTCAPMAFAGHHGWHGHRGYHHGYHRVHYRGHYGHYYHRDHFGRWVAGAIVLGALADLAIDATRPRTVYYSEPPVVYREPPVVYRRAPVVYRQVPVRRVYEERTVYADPYHTRYIRDDGYAGN